MRPRHPSASLAPCAVVLVALTAGPALAAGVWNESLDGDFSNNGLNPTTVTVSAGSNEVIGTAGSTPQGLDRDYFRFTVPTGWQWSGLRLLPGSTISGSASFLGLQAGPQLTVSPSGHGSENLIGYVLYDEGMVGTDLLPGMLGAATPALGSGTYSVWVQELGGVIEYGLDVVLTPVPEPVTWSLMLAGLAALGLRRAGRQGLDTALAR